MFCNCVRVRCSNDDNQTSNKSNDANANIIFLDEQSSVIKIKKIEKIFYYDNYTIRGYRFQSRSPSRSPSRDSVNFDL